MGNNGYKGVMRKYHSLLSLAQRVADVLIVFGLLMALSYFYLGGFPKLYHVAGVLGGMLTWIAMGTVDAYRAWRGASLLQQIKTILLGWILVPLGLISIAWMTKYGDSFSRSVLGLWFVLSPLVISSLHIIQRLFLRYLREKGHNSRKMVIVGAGDLGKQLAERIQKSEGMGMRLLGFFDDDEKKQGEEILGLPVLGKTKEAHLFVQQNNIDQVCLALPMRAEKQMRKVFDALQDTTASVYLIPDLFVFELMGAREQDIVGLPAFALCETPLTGAFGSIKRIEDVLLASLILLCIWPIMLVIALVIKVTSPGSVIFKQDRYGLNGERIKVYKFSSMSVCDNDDMTIRQAQKGDARITPVGAFLRKTSLDELPQFINVLQGHMSIVGPRPHAVAHNEEYRKLIKGYMWRHKVKPGITGWAQINGWRGETDTLYKMEKRVEYDLEYIRLWSVLLDLKIVFLTVFKGFIDKNAY